MKKTILVCLIIWLFKKKKIMLTLTERLGFIRRAVLLFHYFSFEVMTMCVLILFLNLISFAILILFLFIQQ